MTKYVAHRIVFLNGERHSILQRVDGLPVHEVTLYLGRFRQKGRAANTIHFVCSCLALLYNVSQRTGLDIHQRLKKRDFLSRPELDRIIAGCRYRQEDLDEPSRIAKKNVISFNKIGIRNRRKQAERRPVDAQTYASRLRYVSDYLDFLVHYLAQAMTTEQREPFLLEARQGLDFLRGHVPRISQRTRLGSRRGLTKTEQRSLLLRVDPDNADNPWKRDFVRARNNLIIVLLLGTGVRRGELLGIQISDIHTSEPKIDIIRRADAPEDLRKNQPNTKTYDRTIELTISLTQLIQIYLTLRRKIRAARRIPQLLVSERGDALSISAMDKVFHDIRQAMPELPKDFSSHVLRHTWNDRFSEHADELGLSEIAEQRARNTQQGWSDNSNSGARYTRRFTERKARQLSLRIQEDLDVRTRK